MSKKIAVFPGTFDPLTKGHFDIIKRTAKLFDKLYIAVANSPSKHTYFPLDKRIEMAKTVCDKFPNIEVLGFNNMLIDFLKEVNCTILVRGVRTVADYDYEIQLTNMYKTMMPALEIVLLPTTSNLSFISSTLVREVLIHKGDVSAFVEDEIALKIKEIQK